MQWIAVALGDARLSQLAVSSEGGLLSDEVTGRLIKFVF